jgi:hypothetical protein
MWQIYLLATRTRCLVDLLVACRCRRRAYLKVPAIINLHITKGNVLQNIRGGNCVTSVGDAALYALARIGVVPATGDVDSLA